MTEVPQARPVSPLLPPERLREIRARVENATPGPWELVEMGPDSTVHKIGVRYCVDHEHSGRLWHNLIRLEDTAYAQHCSWDQRAKDAAFIAEARTAVPQLLDALETAEAERARFEYLWQLEAKRAQEAEGRAFDSALAKVSAEALVSTLGSALERTDNNFQAILAHSPVRDATETLAEARAALTQFQEFQSALAPTQPEGGSE